MVVYTIYIYIYIYIYIIWWWWAAWTKKCQGWFFVPVQPWFPVRCNPVQNPSVHINGKKERERKIHIFWRKCVVFNSVAMQLLGSSGWFIGRCYAASASEIIVLSSMWFFSPVFFLSTKWNEWACSLRMSKSNHDDWLSKHHLLHFVIMTDWFV